MWKLLLISQVDPQGDRAFRLSKPAIDLDTAPDTILVLRVKFMQPWLFTSSGS